MKKLLCAIGFVCLFSAAIFAESDLQLRLGADLATYYYEIKTGNTTTGTKDDVEVSLAGFTFGLTNYNLFGDKVVRWGFMESVDFSVGAPTKDKYKSSTYINGREYTINGTTTYSGGEYFAVQGSVGPAIGVRLGKVAQLNGAIMFTLQYESCKTKKDGITSKKYEAMPIGATEEIMCKFLPESRFSPIVGFSFSETGLTNLKYDGETADLSNYVYNFQVNTKVFVGGAFNF